MTELNPCPFCGGDAEFERLGTGRTSCIVACTDCGAKLETNETGVFCGRHWNGRVELAAPVAAQEPDESNQVTRWQEKGRELRAKVQWREGDASQPAQSPLPSYDETFYPELTHIPQPAQGERHALQAEGKHPAPCARHCEAQAFKVEIRRLEAQLAKPAPSEADRGAFDAWWRNAEVSDSPCETAWAAWQASAAIAASSQGPEQDVSCEIKRYINTKVRT